MRIAIDLTARLPEPTGVDTYLIQFVVHLSRLDTENRYKIFVNYEDRALFAGILPDNFTVVPMCFRSRPARLFFQQCVLPLEALRWRADVVHSPSFISPLYRGRLRHVVTVHDMTFFSLPDHHISLRRSFLYRWAVLASIQRADEVIVPSRATLRHIAQLMPRLSVDRVRVVPMGIGDEFRPYPSDDVREAVRRLRLPQSYLLYVGTIEPRKNLATLVDSYRQLVVEDGIREHLVLAGRLGWKYRDLLKKLESPEVKDRIHLAGYVSQDDLPWFYAGARLFVYPSLQEGFGFPPLEVMACGIPTVSSCASSLGENLEGAAELVLPTDVAALTSAMRRLLGDNALREKYRVQGLRRAAQFRWTETARETLHVYERAARQSAVNGQRVPLRDRETSPEG